MWESRCLTNLWTSTACCRNIFAFYFTLYSCHWSLLLSSSIRLLNIIHTIVITHCMSSPYHSLWQSSYYHHFNSTGHWTPQYAIVSPSGAFCLLGSNIFEHYFPWIKYSVSQPYVKIGFAYFDPSVSGEVGAVLVSQWGCVAIVVWCIMAAKFIDRK
jgi:hypothetical protein